MFSIKFKQMVTMTSKFSLLFSWSKSRIFKSIKFDSYIWLKSSHYEASYVHSWLKEMRRILFIHVKTNWVQVCHKLKNFPDIDGP